MGQCYSSSKSNRKHRLVTQHGYVGDPSSHNLKTPRTTMTQHQSPTSIIIPEITEHVNHSYSSSDDEDDALHLIQQVSPLSIGMNHNVKAAETSKRILMDGDRHPLAQDIPPLTTVSAKNSNLENARVPASFHKTITGRYSHNQTTNGYSKRNNHSTSLITVERERLRSLNNSTTTSSKALPTTASNEDVVYSSDDGNNSPAVLRRLIAQTKSRLKTTGRIVQQEQHPSKMTTSPTPFSEVHESLTKTIIIEEGEGPVQDSSDAAVSKFPTTAMIDAMAVPSDEENDDTLGGRHSRTAKYSNRYNEPDPALPSLSRRRRFHHTPVTKPVAVANTTKQSAVTTNSKINHRLEKIGPLSPVKLKTAHCVSPRSIRVYDQDRPQDNDIPSIHSVSTSPKTTSHKNEPVLTTSDIGPNSARGSKVNEKDDEAAIDTRTVQNFTKLKLQIQVAARQAQKERLIHKVEDRMNDVQQHRQLWDVYQHIQNDLSSVVNHDTTIIEPKTDTEETVNLLSSNIAETDNVSSINCVESLTLNDSKVSQVRRLRRRKPRRFLRKITRDSTTEETISPSKPAQEQLSVSSPVEYDLEDDIPIITKNKTSPQRRLIVKQSNSSPNETNPTVVDMTNESDVEDGIIGNSSTKRQDRVRSNSFDLHQTETWFFDFQEEFQNVPNHETKPALINPSPVDNYNNHMSSNNSQANLSLLSANSLDVQRRLYAEKRRQRKIATGSNMTVTTSTPKGLPGFLLTDDTPLARNGTNRGSHRTVSSYDYGPSSDGRTPLFSDVRSTPCDMGGSAQEIYNAPNEAEKLRIAKEILRRRNVTNMEVTFTTPKHTRRNNAMVTNENGEIFDVDNSSFISDLDESYTSHHTNRDNQSISSYDYGPQRRPARRTKRQNMDADVEDQASIVSDVSFDLSHKLDNLANDVGATSNASNSKDLHTKSNSKYDFQSIVQRRLDIEERLRALMSSDDPELIPSSSNTANKSVAALVACSIKTSKVVSDSSLLSSDDLDENKLHSSIGASTLDNGAASMGNANLITPNDKGDPTPILLNSTTIHPDGNHHGVDKSTIVTPNANNTPSQYPVYATSSTKGRSDFSRLLDAVEITRPVGAPDTASPKERVVAFTKTIGSDSNGENIAIKYALDAIIEHGSSDIVDDKVHLPDRKQPLSHLVATNAATSLSVINESYESNESPNSCNTMKVPAPYYLREGMSDERSVISHYNSTNETLLLAHQVEAKVHDILGRYRHNDNSATFMTEHQATSTKFHLIENSP